MVWPIIGGMLHGVRRAKSMSWRRLLQLRVLRFSFLQDRDVGISVFPEGKEALVRCFRFGGVALQFVGAAQLKVGKYADSRVQNNSAMVKDFAKLRGSCR